MQLTISSLEDTKPDMYLLITARHGTTSINLQYHSLFKLSYGLEKQNGALGRRPGAVWN
jgi:hypothetical protein